MLPSTILVPLGDPRASQLAADASQLADAIGANLALIPSGGEPSSKRDAVHRLVQSVLEASAHDSGAAIVLSTNGRSGLLDTQQTDAADAVVRSCSNPVVLVGPDIDPQWKPNTGPMMYCYDGAPGSAALEPLVRAWATSLGCPVDVVTVLHRNGEYLGNDDASLVREAHRLVVERLTAEDVQATSTFLDGLDAAHQLAGHAARSGASLVVAAAHSHSGLVHRVLGSTAMRLARSARCPLVAH